MSNYCVRLGSRPFLTCMDPASQWVQLDGVRRRALVARINTADINHRRPIQDIE